MAAVIADPASSSGARIAELPLPRRAPSEALVDVHAFTLNRGELLFLGGQPPGSIPGWDAAGVIREPPAGQQHLAAGSRVVTFGWGGAWASQRSVASDELALLPDSVSFQQAAAIPTAGVTALRAVQRLGDISDQRVLVTGAAGGVGRFAVQLVRLAGGRPLALLSEYGRGKALRSLDVDVTVGEVSEPVDAILDHVGGQILRAALSELRDGGTCLLVGAAANPNGARDQLPSDLTAGKRVEPFEMGSGLGTDMSALLGLVAEARLDVAVGWHGSWHRFEEVAQLQLSGRLLGKAVLEVD